MTKSTVMTKDAVIRYVLCGKYFMLIWILVSIGLSQKNALGQYSRFGTGPSNLNVQPLFRIPSSANPIAPPLPKRREILVGEYPTFGI